MDERFSGDLAALTSASTQLTDLLARVTSTAERFDADHVDDVANDLFEVERHLHAAGQRLDALLRRLR